MAFHASFKEVGSAGYRVASGRGEPEGSRLIDPQRSSALRIPAGFSHEENGT